MNHPWNAALYVPLALLSLGALGCDGAPPQADTLAAHSSPQALKEVGLLSPCAPLEELASLDTRKPLPLKPIMAWHQKQNMMDHLVAIQGIVEALSIEDWEGVAKASAAIESSPHMARMCEHMGAGAEGFTELALDFHHRAEGIAVAARAQDGPGVLRATADTLATCTSCHSLYRQEVVDGITWQRVTGSSHAPQ